MVMASSSRSPLGALGPNNVQPYRMHVSQKYLDLTRQKLELTRLPREPQGSQSRLDFGVTKTELEPLVDHWMESYDWRAQESFYNDHLPQYRAAVNGTRIHFVHKRSSSPFALPLLFIHGWPESFIAVSHMIDSLCNPISTPPRGDEHVPAFHVVVPSIPGFGFSDMVPEDANNMQVTAHVFDALMKGLGYTQYLVHGSGWGFKIARLIALGHPESCIAIHTVNPDVPPPRSSYGYTPEDVAISNLTIQAPGMTPGMTPGATPPLPSPAVYPQPAERPQTTAYALCDSPPGLLAYVIDAIKPLISKSPSSSPHSLTPGSRGHSPVMVRTPGTPGSAATPGHGRSPQAPQGVSPGGHSPSGLELADLHHPWTPTALISWTMIYWLPGPEVALRWLVNSAPLTSSLWLAHCNVPLGISHFRETVPSPAGPGTGQTPPQWAEAYHRVAMVRRREGRVRFAAWERPAELVMDIRELAGILGAGGPPMGPEMVPGTAWQ